MGSRSRRKENGAKRRFFFRRRRFPISPVVRRSQRSAERCAAGDVGSKASHILALMSPYVAKRSMATSTDTCICSATAGSIVICTMLCAVFFIFYSFSAWACLVYPLDLGLLAGGSSFIALPNLYNFTRF